MVLAQSGEVLVQLLDSLLVCFDALSFQTFVELHQPVRILTLVAYARGIESSLSLTLFRLRSSKRR